MVYLNRGDSENRSVERRIIYVLALNHIEVRDVKRKQNGPIKDSFWYNSANLLNNLLRLLLLSVISLSLSANFDTLKLVELEK